MNMKFATLSLCMIVKNEENVIDNILSDINRAVDEIIIVDTGSTDRTKEICSKYTDKIYDFEWINDFAAARNESIKYATSDYIIVMDADYRISNDNVDKLIELKHGFLFNNLQNAKYVTFMINNDFFNKGELTPSLNLFKNNEGLKYRNLISEEIYSENFDITEKIKYIDINYSHERSNIELIKSHTHKYIDFIYERTSNGYTLSLRELFVLSFLFMENYRNVNDLYFVRNMLIRYCKEFKELADGYTSQDTLNAAVHNIEYINQLIIQMNEEDYDMKKKKISLCMIVKNEENYIGRCLGSIHDIVDEIIIVDTGSTDRTKEICSKYTDKIYDFKWINDFAAARNYSFSKATGKYIMWLDADDILLDVDREKLKNLKTKLTDKIVPVSMIYDYSFDRSGNVTLSLRRNRIIKNDNKDHWEGFVHEVISCNIQNSYESDIHVTHTRTHSNGTRNIDLFESKINSGDEFNSRNTLYYAKELYYNGRYDDAIVWFGKYFNKEDKWVEDIIDALIKVSDIYRIKEDIAKQRQYLYKTFDYAIRAEALYPLGVSFTNEKKYDQAIHFYESILNLEFPVNCNGFLRNDEWNIKPIIELSCAYYYKNDKVKAKEYHLKAKQLDPNNGTVLFNDQFFNY